jgi:inositol phosphorylceramide mannosyltransferase catalytic subunit
MDLDIGCLRPLDPLLGFPVLLPKTIPVGVSNDLMFAAKGHPFLAQSIHNLVTFDHNWVLNYPTVMFSTGPMFLSAQYTIYTSSHASSPESSVRILPRSLYGKNAPEGEAPHSFFTHFYGSSWHSDDAGFIGFLGTRGKVILRIGVFVLMIGGIRMLMHATRQRRHSTRGYDLLFPRMSSRTGRWKLTHLPRLSMGTSSSTSSSVPSSPDESGPLSPSGLPVFHFDMRPGSPASSEASYAAESNYPSRPSSPFYDAYRRVRSRVSSAAGLHPDDAHRISPRAGRRRKHNRGVLFFLPAILQPWQDIEMDNSPAPREPSMPVPRLPPGRGWFGPDQRKADLEAGPSSEALLIDPTDGESSSRPQGTGLTSTCSALSARTAVGDGDAQLIDFSSDDTLHPNAFPVPRTTLTRSQSLTGPFTRLS